MAAGLVSLAAVVTVAGLVACRGGETSSVPLDTAPSPLAEGGPPPPPAGAFLGQIPPDRSSQLTRLGVVVVVPGQVPSSFSIAELRVDQSDTGPGYLVVYQNASNQCFAIEFAATGIGAPPATESRIAIRPPLFGDQGYQLHYGPFADADLSTEFPQPNLFTDWMTGPSGAYRLIGATYIGDLFESLGGCEDVPIPEAVALAESLTILTGDTLESSP